jgi:DNA-binding Lrp family transcriptional regulator
VPPFDEHIHGCDNPAVRHRHNRRVVTWADGDVGRLRQPCSDSRHEAELAKIGNRDDSVACPSGTVWLAVLSAASGGHTAMLGVPVTVQAYILIQTEVGKAAAVAMEIQKIKGVTMAEDVTGPYDVIVRSEAKSVDELGKLVVAKVQAVPGITRTLTCPVVHL